MTVDFESVSNGLLVLLLFVTAAALVWVSAWRLTLFLLLALYLLLAAFLMQLVAPAVALVRVVSGGLVALIFLITLRGVAGARHGGAADARAFRAFAALFVAICILAISLATNFLGIAWHIQLGAVWLLAAGLLIAILARDALPFGIGALVFTGGFSLLEIAIEGSLFLYGLLNIADLLIALVAAHLASLGAEVEGGRRRGESA